MVATVLGAVVGSLSAFEALWTFNGAWVGVAGAVLAAIALTVGLARAFGGPAGPLAATGGWFFSVVYLGGGRPEGDVVVPGTAQGLTFLLLGVLGCVLGIRDGAKQQQRFTSAPDEPKTTE
jgi:hypothetical protein